MPIVKNSIVLTLPNSAIAITVITRIHWIHFAKARMCQIAGFCYWYFRLRSLTCLKQYIYRNIECIFPHSFMDTLSWSFVLGVICVKFISIFEVITRHRKCSKHRKFSLCTETICDPALLTGRRNFLPRIWYLAQNRDGERRGRGRFEYEPPPPPIWDFSLRIWNLEEVEKCELIKQILFM